MHTLFETEDEVIHATGARGSHLLKLLNPAMGSLANSSHPIGHGELSLGPLRASIGAIWMLTPGPPHRDTWTSAWVGPESGGPFHALLFLHALCHFGGC